MVAAADCEVVAQWQCNGFTLDDSGSSPSDFFIVYFIPRGLASVGTELLTRVRQGRYLLWEPIWIRTIVNMIMKHYIIYQIRNKLNGMIYVGQHQTEDLNDGYMGSGVKIIKAIEKYGIENFEKTILFDFDNFKEMNAKEIEIVNEDFIARDDVYNLIPGGNSWNSVNMLGFNMNGNWKSLAQHCRDIYEKTGKWPHEGWLAELKDSNPRKYDEYCRKISDGLRTRIKKYGSWWKGKRHSDETIQKMKDFHTQNHPQAGSRNSQYGMIAIYNKETFERATQSKDQPIPEGWAKGRFYNATPEELKQRKRLVEEILRLDSKSKVSIRMKLSLLQKILQKILNPKSKIKETEKDHEFKRLQKEKYMQEKTELLTRQYEFYREYGWDEFMKEFKYQYSYPNFVQQCKKYVKEFVPQNGKKRGKKL